MSSRPSFQLADVFGVQGKVSWLSAVPTDHRTLVDIESRSSLLQAEVRDWARVSRVVLVFPGLEWVLGRSSDAGPSA